MISSCIANDITFTNCSKILQVLDQVFKYFGVYYSLFMMTVHVWNNNIICLLSTKANYISYFYIPNNLAMTDIETMKTPTHLKNCLLASNSVSFFGGGIHSGQARSQNTGLFITS